MLVPLFGFLLSAAFFATVGVIVLRLSGIRPITLPVLAMFVVSAQIGVLAFGAAYGAVFANADDQLTSGGAVVGMLVGMPLAGSFAGWLVARSVARRWQQRARS